MNLRSPLCQNCKQAFTVEPEDFVFYQKMEVPPPTFCPQCRYQRRLANRNEWNFYKRDCGLCGKGMVSLYSEEFPGPVYCRHVGGKTDGTPMHTDGISISPGRSLNNFTSFGSRCRVLPWLIVRILEVRLPKFSFLI